MLVASLLCSAWFSAVLLCSALVLYSALESCPAVQCPPPTECFSWSSRKAEVVESRTQLVKHNARTALPHDRCWSQVCAKELTRYQTAAGPMQTLLDFSTRVGMDHGPTGGRALHKVEINNAITSMQCGATQCHAMHAPTWCLGALYSLFALHLKSEPKMFCCMLPIKAKLLVPCWEYVPLALLPEMSYFSKGFFYRHLLNH